MAWGLLSALAARDDIEASAYALSWRGRHDLATALPAGIHARSRPFPARLVRDLWERGASEPRIERWSGRVDVVHALNYVAPPSRAPVLVLIHDLSFVRFPELCTPDTLRYPTLIEHALERGATVHTHSEYIAAEVRAEFKLPLERVVPINPGIPTVGTGIAAAGARLARGPRYVLALGTIEPRKNLTRLVDAFGAVAAKDPDVRLVVAGPDGWDRGQLVAAVAESTARERIVRLGYVTDEQRLNLLAGASVFAYPSVYEGFGFPPLEAMTAGVPVVAGRAGSLPEVLGDAATLVDPSDTDALAIALLDLLQDDGARNEHIARGRAQAARYSWERMAAEVVDLYRALT